MLRKEIVEQVKKCLDAPTEEAECLPGMMLVSRKWMSNWKVRSCKVGYLNECMSPTASITCRHGKLLPAAAATKAGCGSVCLSVSLSLSLSLSLSVSLSLVVRMVQQLK